MQLLQTCSVPQAEYACLSILMDNSSIDVESFVELATIASPLATTSPVVATSSLIELHDHLSEKFKKNSNAQINNDKSIVDNHHTPRHPQEDKIGSSNQFSNGVSRGKMTSLQAQHEALVNGLAIETEAELQTQMNDNERLQTHGGRPSIQDMCIAEDEYYELQHRRQRSCPSSSFNHATGGAETHSHCTQSGMVLEYIVIREKNLVEKCISTFQPMVQNTGTNKNADLNLPYKAAVVTIGISGSPFRTNFSPHAYTLRKRLEEFVSSINALKLCKAYINGNETNKNASDQRQDLELMLMSLLMDDESLKTNSQFDAQYGNNVDTDTEMVFNTKNPSKSKLFPKKLKFAEKRRRKKGTNAEEVAAKNVVSTTLLSSSAPSSEIAKIISDQMQVLSLAEKDMKLRGYTKQNGSGKAERDRTSGMMRSPGKADRDRLSGIMKSPTRASRRIGRELAGFDYVPPEVVNNFNPVPIVNSFGFGTGSFSDGTSVTATTVSTDSSSSGPVPTLSGPSRDSSSTKRQLRRNKVLAASIANQRSRTWNSAFPMKNGDIEHSPQRQKGGLQSNFDPFAEDSEDFVNGASTSGNLLQPSSPPVPSRKMLKPSKPTARPSSYVPGSRKLFIAMALNEDLSCTYRGSKLTSCVVEGIVQLQMKSKSTAFVPFVVRIKDDDDHAGSIQENSDIANDLSHENEGNGWKYKFIVTLPKADSYYPVLKYTCSNAMVPVPLVSTRALLCYHWLASSMLTHYIMYSITESSIKSANK
jgi:hypothetical protein